MRVVRSRTPGKFGGDTFRDSRTTTARMGVGADRHIELAAVDQQLAAYEGHVSRGAGTGIQVGKTTDPAER
jgi:hypothetical protein